MVTSTHMEPELDLVSNCIKLLYRYSRVLYSTYDVKCTKGAHFKTQDAPSIMANSSKLENSRALVE
jgi:hypothetical protein